MLIFGEAMSIFARRTGRRRRTNRRACGQTCRGSPRRYAHETWAPRPGSVRVPRSRRISSRKNCRVGVPLLERGGRRTRTGTRNNPTRMKRVPLEPQPADVVFYRVDVLDILFFRSCIVEPRLQARRTPRHAEIETEDLAWRYEDSRWAPAGTVVTTRPPCFPRPCLRNDFRIKSTCSLMRPAHKV